jgi:hypothetical protein
VWGWWWWQLSHYHAFVPRTINQLAGLMQVEIHPYHKLRVIIKHLHMRKENRCNKDEEEAMRE